MMHVLSAIAHVGSGDRILDAGCGIGGSSLWLAKNFGVWVVGLNINKKQLEIAERLVIKEQLSHKVKFLEGDFTNTKLSPNSFDVAWFIESGCHAENKYALLAETYRILKPGGRLIYADGFIAKENMSAEEDDVIRRWLQGWSVPSLTKLVEFDMFLKRLNFRNVTYRDAGANVMPSSRKMYRAAVLSYPVGKLLEWLWSTIFHPDKKYHFGPFAIPSIEEGTVDIWNFLCSKITL